MGMGNWNMIIYTNPLNLQRIKEILDNKTKEVSSYIHTLHSYKIYTDPNIPVNKLRKWILPQERFIEYEESDISWLMYCHYGKGEYEPVYYGVREDLFISSISKPHIIFLGKKNTDVNYIY